MLNRTMKSLLILMLASMVIFVSSIVSADDYAPKDNGTSIQYPAFVPIVVTEVIRQKGKDDVWINTPFKLSASIDMPKDKTTGVVVIIPGGGAENRDGVIEGEKNVTAMPLALLAKNLAEKGIAVVRYDKFGVGKSTRRAGDLSKIPLETLVNHASTVLAWTRKQKPFAGLPVYAIGRNEGGLIALSIAWQAPKLVDGIACIDIPASSPWVWLWKQTETVLKSQGETSEKIKSLEAEFVRGVTAILNNQRMPALLPAITSLLSYQNQDYMKQLFSMEPLAYSKELKVPALFMVTPNSGYALDDAQRLAKAVAENKIKSNSMVIKQPLAQSKLFSDELTMYLSDWIKVLK